MFLVHLFVPNDSSLPVIPNLALNVGRLVPVTRCQILCVDVDLIGWAGVGLGGTYGCKCGILYAPMLGVAVYTY